MNRKVARIIALIMALVLLLSLGYMVVDSLFASAGVSQSEINKLREEKKEYEKKKQEIQSRINTIEFERMSEVAKKSVLDDRISLTGMEIENITATIDQYILLIADKEVELVEAKAREDAQFVLYKARVRDMEENGVISYLEIVFDSTSFSDLLARIDFVGDIMRADEVTYNGLIAAKLETKEAKDALEQTKVELEDEKADREDKLEELAVQVDEASALIAQIQASLESEQSLYDEAAAEAARIQRDINAKTEELRKQEEAEARRRAEAKAMSQRTKGTGELMWPVPSSNNVTSGYGIRPHPVFKVMRQHWGIDIGAKHGANVVASDSGTVITSSYNSSYGNYIVISHGNVNGTTMTTLYAHLSSKRVSEGASVSKGQVIGLIGSTGISTGPHLHFEVTVNGSRINPLNRL